MEFVLNFHPDSDWSPSFPQPGRPVTTISESSVRCAAGDGVTKGGSLTISAGRDLSNSTFGNVSIEGDVLTCNST
eukprot:gene5307-15480_t